MLLGRDVSVSGGKLSPGLRGSCLIKGYVCFQRYTHVHQQVCAGHNFPSLSR